MKKLITILLLIAIAFNGVQAQFLKKLKEKVNQAVGKSIEDNKKKETATKTETTGEENNIVGTGEKNSLKVYSKFDFIPGSKVLYYDNFEKDNIGETPLGWITSNSSEVVTVEGLEGKWIILLSKGGAKNIIRNKKQSWGDNFTIEFDIFIDPELSKSTNLYILLANSSGKMVTDETLLQSFWDLPRLGIAANIGSTGITSALYAGRNMESNAVMNAAKYLTDNDFKESLTKPVHISFCVQGKRLRMWWNNKKIIDANNGIDPEAIPNMLAFSCHYYTDTKYYLSNIRIAKDVPDTRMQFTQGKVVSNLLFYIGTDKLKPESMGSLVDISKLIKEATTEVKIIGHTDSDGADADNLALSQKRAEAVKAILAQEFGVPQDKMKTEGRGEAQPMADNQSAEGKAQNRRVEFIFNPAADNYKKTAGQPTTAQPSAVAKTTSNTASTEAAATGSTVVTLQNKVLNTKLPFAYIMKTGDGTYTFMASKEEGNSNENFFEIKLQSIHSKLKPETYNFVEINKKNPLYGSKQFAEIKETKVKLHYGASTKPYISDFSPIIAANHFATYYDESLAKKFPPASALTKFVIESVDNNMISGYFTVGAVVGGLKAITKGDAMTQTFTNGFSGELKCKFTNVPIQ